MRLLISTGEVSGDLQGSFLIQSLYKEAPGMEPYRPNQKTPIKNFFLAGSYTQQDYIDSMEGATMSGHLAAAAILHKPVDLATNKAVA